MPAVRPLPDGQAERFVTNFISDFRNFFGGNSETDSSGNTTGNDALFSNDSLVGRRAAFYFLAERA